MSDVRNDVTKPSGGASANQIAVRVFANEVEGKVVFTHDWSANAQPPQDPPIELPRWTADWTLDFTLYDFTTRGLQFTANADDAMWVHNGNGCPKGKGNGGHVGFGSVGSGSPDGTRNRLTVTNDNSGDACVLHFMLNFEGRQKKYSYDPEIKNGGMN